MNVKTFCMAVLLSLSASVVQAQDVVIRRNTTTTTTTTSTTTSTTTVSKQKPKPNQKPKPSKPVPTDVPEQTFTANSVSFKMIRVEGQGTPFYIGETEVTQALWQAVMGSNPSSFKGTNRPVEQVSWNDCQEFISKLNSLTGKNFRLPTEAEWEYAAKGGNKSHGYEYSGDNDINEVAWYNENAFLCGSESENSSHPDYGTHPVKTKKPNELGIYDMSGNVWEWCEGFFDSSSTLRTYRGGSWWDKAIYSPVNSRYCASSLHRRRSLGLRLAL